MNLLLRTLMFVRQLTVIHQKRRSSGLVLVRTDGARQKPNRKIVKSSSGDKT
jgi:hypothetical protein